MILDPPGDPTDMWLHSERYLSAGTKSYSRFATINEVDQQYRPESDTRDFMLPCLNVQQSAPSRFLSTAHSLAPSLQRLYAPSPDGLRLPIHPATLPRLDTATRKRLANQEPSLRLRVSPTSSTRTVFVHAADRGARSEPHSLKMHFPGRISRFTRQLTRRDVELQLWVSQQLQNAHVPHLADVAGGYCTFENTSIGFLLRARRPECAVTAPLLMVSGFALYAGDHRATADPPLLAQLPRLFHENPTTFVIERIVAPIVRLWVRTVRTLGIVPELHGQNTLFCFDHNYTHSDISMRDCDLFIDTEGRNAMGLGTPESLVEPDQDVFRRRRAGLLSLCYDGFLVQNFLKSVAASAGAHLGVREDALRDAAKEAFKSEGGDDLALPERAYYFSDDVQSNHLFSLRSRKTRSLWR